MTTSEVMMSFRLNKLKALHSLLYVINSMGKVDKHKLFKILYFADIKHLLNYGRPIAGDTYLKMDFGPVPSFSKELVEGKISEFNVIHIIESYQCITDKLSDPDQLSESDIECLNESISENTNLTFDQLTDKSHDFAYFASDWIIDPLDMAKAGGADQNTLHYILSQIESEHLESKIEALIP